MEKEIWARRRTAAGRSAVLLAMALGLAACEDGQMPGFLKAQDGGTAGSTASGKSSKQMVERDIEAPDVFQATEAGLWDGRPSLGGVWVAHPDVTEPERVIVRNEQNGKFVIGALFRRERETPGPRLQVSSDAAAALGMLAGAPTNINVVALRREEVAEEAPPQTDIPPVSDGTASAVGGLDAPSAISEGTLEPVTAAAAAAIDRAPATPPLAPSAAAAAPKPAAPVAAKPVPAQSATTKSNLSKPFIQIGIFSVEGNANNTATAMRQAGMVPTVKKQSSSGTAFWRVLVGPAQNSGELDTLLKKIKASGFTDAYAVSN
ncbi:SPOR domain-containing protein [Puniceibacterium sp. IMCC21224]|uniref:SPOR domain-containing protein n=1 Tax=Puniceibacterium sp. IMCC21224 TaxID=1618204 RepID=UPI00064DDBB9|nr:SPOR domain-containing protein [Puniceibacterium sp. IMCC21224]KMK67739.1 sporulation related protein [Puniceibacterium sp. IMCC21224]